MYRHGDRKEQDRIRTVPETGNRFFGEALRNNRRRQDKRISARVAQLVAQLIRNQ